MQTTNVSIYTINHLLTSVPCMFRISAPFAILPDLIRLDIYDIFQRLICYKIILEALTIHGIKVIYTEFQIML